MAGLVVTDSTHHRLSVLSATLKVKKQDIADFLVRSALDLALDDGIMDRLRGVSDKREIPLADVLLIILNESNGQS